MRIAYCEDEQAQAELARDYMVSWAKKRNISCVVDLFSTFHGAMAFALQLLAGVAYAYIVLKAMAGSVSAGQVLMYAGAIITMMGSIRNVMKLQIEIDYSNEYLKTY